MFCYNCGAKIEDGEKFCYKCGSPVKNRPDEESGSQVKVAEEQKTSSGFTTYYQEPLESKPFTLEEFLAADSTYEKPIHSEFKKTASDKKESKAEPRPFYNKPATKQEPRPFYNKPASTTETPKEKSASSSEPRPFYNKPAAKQESQPFDNTTMPKIEPQTVSFATDLDSSDAVSTTVISCSAGKLGQVTKGKVIPYTEIPDEQYAQGRLGIGVGIEPEEGAVYAPCNGKITTVASMKHVIGIEGPGGMSILIHIGIGTNKMKGDGFKPFVKEGNEVVKGQKLLEFDRSKIKAAGHSDTIVFLLVNSDDYKHVEYAVNKDKLVSAPAPRPSYKKPAAKQVPRPFYNRPAAKQEPRPFYNKPAAKQEPRPFYNKSGSTPETSKEKPTTASEPRPFYNKPAAKQEPRPFYNKPTSKSDSQAVSLPTKMDSSDVVNTTVIRCSAGALGQVTKGKVIPYTQIPDDLFSQGILGVGVGIEPEEGIAYAPCDGKITSVAYTKHAIGIEGPGKMDILIHVGVDTVEMQGNGFKTFVKEGDKVVKGQKLLEFDCAKIKAAGHPDTVVFLFTNFDDYMNVVFAGKK